MQCKVKICGVTSVEDADIVLESGADALGVNLIPSSKRYVELQRARAIVDRVRGRMLTVAVLADPTPETAATILRELGVDRLQLHGDESPEQLSQLGPTAFKAVRIADSSDVQRAAQYSGDLLLVDAKVPGALGGTGTTFDWSLVAELARSRQLIVAGGLSADNVARAIHALRPWAVDVASGVEEPSDPRKKSLARVTTFLAQVRASAS